MFSNNIFNIKNWFNGSFFPNYYYIPILLTSYFSVGFYHLDEHFQIIEMANYKLGGILDSQMPWEFKNQLRPTLQPFIFYLFLKLSFLKNPYFITFIFRLFTGVLSILAFLLLFDLNVNIKKYKTLYFQSAFLIWFMPFISVRYSSETWSALFLVFGIYSLIRYIEFKNKILLIFSCIAFCSSFWFRFQIGFAILGFALWILINKKLNWKEIVFITFISISIIYLFIQLDHWFYTKEVLTPLNYFNETILHKSKNFGDYGMWYYPALLFIHLFPVSIVLFISIYFLFKNHRNDMIFYTIVPFICIHFIIGHKETRFLFPLYLFIPYLIVLSGEYFKNLKTKYSSITNVFIVLNILFLIICCFKPADIKVFNGKQLSNNGTLKENIFITENGRKEFHNLYPMFYQNYSFDSTKPSVQYLLDDIKTPTIKNTTLPFLIQYDWQKIFYWTKAEDCFGSLNYIPVRKNQNTTK